MNRLLLPLLFVTPAWSLAADALQPVSPEVARCYERLLDRVPKRTAYTSILASEAQLAAGQIERRSGAFSPRIPQAVDARVIIRGSGWRDRHEVPLWLKCGLSNGRIVTWEVEKRVSQHPG